MATSDCASCGDQYNYDDDDDDDDDGGDVNAGYGVEPFVKVCADNLRARPPATSWSTAAADLHAKDVSALRENLIVCAKGVCCV